LHAIRAGGTIRTMQLISPETVARMAAYQDQLAEAEALGAARLAEAFGRAPKAMGVHEIDRETRIVRVNDEELTLLGYTREEMVGHLALEFIVMNETAERAIARKLSEQQELKPLVRAFKRKDGVAIPLVLLDRHLRNAPGEIVGLRTVLTPAEGALVEG
jgi:PAS domain S-box-containing protein